VTGRCRLSQDLQVAGNVRAIVATTVCATPTQVAQAAGQINVRPIRSIHVTQFQNTRLYAPLLNLASRLQASVM